MDENDLRAALRDYAASYRPTGRPPDRPANAPRTRNRRALVAVPAVAAAAAAAVVIGTQVGSDGPTGSSVSSGMPGNPVIIELAGYAAPKVGHIIPTSLQRHLSCMREHGYPLPDPTWTGHGWLLTVTEGRALDIGGEDWKQTAFVTCALTRPGHDGVPGLRHALLHPRPRYSGTGHR